MSDFEHVFEQPPEGAAADWTIPQNWAAYTEVEHQTWDTLYARQMKIGPGRACEAGMRMPTPTCCPEVRGRPTPTWR